MAESKPGEKKGQGSGLMALALAGGLGIAGIYLWSKVSGSGPGTGTDELAQQQQKLLTILEKKWATIADFQDQIYVGNRTPTDQEFQVLSQMHEDAALEEQSIHETYKTQFMDAAAEFARDLGYYVVIPGVVGFIFAAAIYGYWRYRKPPTKPPTCPKDGISFPTVEDLQAHVSQHKITTSSSLLALANQEWQSQPSFTMQTTAVIGTLYGKAYTSMASWGALDVRNWSQGAAYAYGTEMGTMGTLAALGRTMAMVLV